MSLLQYLGGRQAVEHVKAEWNKRSGSIRGQAGEVRARGRGGRGGTAKDKLRSMLRRAPECYARARSCNVTAEELVIDPPRG